MRLPRSVKIIKVRKLVLWICAVVFAYIMGAPACELLTTGYSARPGKKLIIGHRCAGGLAPENTLRAVDSGLAHHVDLLELDVRQTIDSQVVVVHDKSINRTTDGKGKVKNLTAAAVTGATVREGSQLHQGLHVPLLEDVLKKIKGQSVQLIVEIKDPDAYPGMMKRIAKLVGETGTSNLVMIFSFNREVLDEAKSLMPGVKTGLFILGSESMKKISGVDYICPNIWGLIYRPRLPEIIHKKGAKIFVWTVDKPYLLRYLKKKDVDGIISNRPDLVTQIMAE